ncbi:MAG TPA: hypothetical protein VEX62_08515 [Candidatus Limnocylindrales bacterium]|nr:hypothetical protein [Candidatus Limnocylindrales bacterium]
MKHSRTALTLCLALAATLTFVACSAAAASAPNADSASRAQLEQPPADNPPDGGGTDPNDGDGKVNPGNPGTGNDDPITMPPIDEPPVDLPLPVGATPVEPVPGVVDAIPHAWDHIDVAADGRTITVYYWGGVDSCYGLDRVDTTFKDGVLNVTVFEGRLGNLPADTACIEIAVLKSVTLTLDQPVIAPSE